MCTPYDFPHVLAKVLTTRGTSWIIETKVDLIINLASQQYRVLEVIRYVPCQLNRFLNYSHFKSNSDNNFNFKLSQVTTSCVDGSRNSQVRTEQQLSVLRFL